MSGWLANLLNSTDWRRTLEETLAIGGIALAYIHANRLKKQVKGVQEIRGGLEEIRESLPTQPLGEFPLYLRDIVRLVQQAKQKITIFCDVPAYGVFSDPDEFLKYTFALEERASHDVQLTIACLKTDLRVRKTDQEFTKPNWEEWKKDERNLEHIKRLLNHHGLKTQPSDVTRGELVKLLCAVDNDTLEHTFAAATQVLLPVSIPLYFWLVDDTFAVFAIPSYHDRAIEHGFYTQDPWLIQGLRDIHDRYFDECCGSSVTEAEMAVTT
jgi:hypothetical protein